MIQQPILTTSLGSSSSSSSLRLSDSFRIIPPFSAQSNTPCPLADPHTAISISSSQMQKSSLMNKSFSENFPTTTTSLQNALKTDIKFTLENECIENPSNQLKLDAKFFKEKSHIKPWLQKRLSTLGINIVIERSDDTKIVFKCKHSFTSGANKRCSLKSNTLESKKKKICPFRIRANYSIRLKHWSLVIVNDSHNHPLPHININDFQIENSKSQSQPQSQSQSQSQAQSQSQSQSRSNSKDYISPLSMSRSSSNSNSSCSISPNNSTNSLKYNASLGPMITPILPTLESSTFLRSNNDIISNNILPGNSNRHLPVDYLSNKLPPINIPNNPHLQNDYLPNLKYKGHVKRIEDTLKDIEKIDFIPDDSKEKIYNNVLSVLHTSISEVQNNNIGIPPYQQYNNRRPLQFQPQQQNHVQQHQQQPHQPSMLYSNYPQLQDRVVLPSLNSLKTGINDNIPVKQHNFTILLRYDNELGNNRYM